MFRTSVLPYFCSLMAIALCNFAPLFGQEVIPPPSSPGVVTSPYCTVDHSQGPSYEAMKALAACNEDVPGDFGVALRLVIVRQDGGTGDKVTPEYLDEMFGYLDEKFGKYGIHFLLKCTKYLDDSQVYNLNPLNPSIQAAVSMEFGNDPTAVTLVLLNGFERSGMAGRGSGYAQAGIGFKPDPAVDFRYKRVIAHELGHALGLYHTHESNLVANDGSETSEEFVDGSNCCEGGDLVCDTPADPNTCGNLGNGSDVDCDTWQNVGIFTNPFDLDSQGDAYVQCISR